MKRHVFSLTALFIALFAICVYLMPFAQETIASESGGSNIQLSIPTQNALSPDGEELDPPVELIAQMDACLDGNAMRPLSGRRDIGYLRIVGGEFDAGFIILDGSVVFDSAGILQEFRFRAENRETRVICYGVSVLAWARVDGVSLHSLELTTVPEEAEAPPTEQISLGYTEVEWTY